MECRQYLFSRGTGDILQDVKAFPDIMVPAINLIKSRKLKLSEKATQVIDNKPNWKILSNPECF